MQCQDSRGSFDRSYGNGIQLKLINYFAIKFPRYANKHWLKTAYTIVQPTAVQQRFCLYLLSSITCAVASSIQKYFATFTFQIRKAQGGNSFASAISQATLPQQAGSTQPKQALHGHTHTSGQENSGFLTQQAPTKQGN